MVALSSSGGKVVTLVVIIELRPQHAIRAGRAVLEKGILAFSAYRTIIELVDLRTSWETDAPLCSDYRRMMALSLLQNMLDFALPIKNAMALTCRCSNWRDIPIASTDPTVGA